MINNILKDIHQNSNVQNDQSINQYYLPKIIVVMFFIIFLFWFFFRILPTVYWQRPSWQRFMQFPIVCERTRIWTFWPNIPFSMKTQYTVRPPKSYSPELKILWRNECTIFSFSKMRYGKNKFFLMFLHVSKSQFIFSDMNPDCSNLLCVRNFQSRITIQNFLTKLGRHILSM